MKFKFLVAAYLFTNLAFASGGTKPELKEVVIALKPDKNPETMLSERNELENELSKILGLKVKVIVPSSSAVILQGMANATIDLGYLSSLDMVNAERTNAADILLVGKIKGHTYYESYWLTKKENSYKNIQDLKNKPVAFASRTSTSGYLIPYLDLIKRGLVLEKQDPETFFGKGNVWYGTGYMTAVQRVLDGTAEAAAVSDYVLNGDKHMTAEQKSKLRLLQTQGPVPTHVVAVRKGLSARTITDLKKALLTFNSKVELRDKVFTSELVEGKSELHLKNTREALNKTGLVIETK